MQYCFRHVRMLKQDILKETGMTPKLLWKEKNPIFHWENEKTYI